MADTRRLKFWRMVDGGLGGHNRPAGDYLPFTAVGGHTREEEPGTEIFGVARNLCGSLTGVGGATDLSETVALRYAGGPVLAKDLEELAEDQQETFRRSAGIA